MDRRSWTVIALAGVLAVGAVAAASPAAAADAAAGSTASVAPTVTADATATVGGLTYRADPYPVRDVPVDQLPFATMGPVSLEDAGVHDDGGVRMALVRGQLVNHPVAQAEYALHLLDSYRLTKDPAFLVRAGLQAQRLLDTSVESGGARFFPYPFDFALHGDVANLLHAPWYSGMAQGLALATFVRMYEASGEPAWRTAADEAFASFLVPRAEGSPWVTLVTPDGLLWFEEYASDTPDYTFNGHIFATFGIFDYYSLTRSADALKLLQGALTSVVAVFPTIRNPGWVSRYCLTHAILSVGYHLVDTGQLLELYTMTGVDEFAQFADDLVADYPDPNVGGPLLAAAGAHTGYTFTATGLIAKSKSAVLHAPSGATVDRRTRIRNHPGYWLRVTSGIWAGYYVQETASAYITGEVASVAYSPPRSITIEPGSETGSTFGANGSVTATYGLSVAGQITAHADRRAIIDGSPYMRIVDGDAAGFWLPESASVHFTDAAGPAGDGG